MDFKLIRERSAYVSMIAVSFMVMYFKLNMYFIFANCVLIIATLIVLGEKSLFPFTHGKKVRSWVSFYAVILILAVLATNIINNADSSASIIVATIVSIIIFGIFSAIRGWYLRL